MKKNIFATMCLSLTLVLAFAASASAIPVTTTSSVTGAYWAPYSPLPATDPLLAGLTITPGYSLKQTAIWTGTSDGSVAAGSSFNMDLILRGSWDSVLDTVGNPGYDYFKVQYKLAGASSWSTFTVSDINFDNADGGVGKAASLNFLLPGTGVYNFQAFALVTSGGPGLNVSQEGWEFVNANITPTPLPGAVWLLGSGLLGFMGFKRTRRNAA